MADARPDVCIATITLVREPGEETLLRAALAALTALQLPVVVADGGSGGEFRSFVRKLPRTTLVEPDSPGLVPQVKASLAAAAGVGAGFILYTESDKQTFFATQIERFFARSPSEVENVGVVIAGRSPASFASFPATQRFAERTINELTGESLGSVGDYSYGPFLMRRSLVPLVLALPNDLGWGWRHALFALTARRRLGLAHVVGDYWCPKDQRHEDEGEKRHRLRQLAQNIQGLLAGMEGEV